MMTSNNNENTNENREVIHVALGNDSCMVSSYWMYLQGLAGSNSNNTDNDNNIHHNPNSNICNMNVTHSNNTLKMNDHDYYYTPRALFIDQPSHHHHDDTSSSLLVQPQNQRQDVRMKNNTDTPATLNGFHIDVMNPFGENLYMNHDDINRMYNNTNNSDSINSNNWDMNLYRVPQQQQTSTKKSKTFVSHNGRHVNWDDDDNEQEEEQEDEDYHRVIYHQQQQQQQQRAVVTTSSSQPSTSSEMMLSSPATAAQSDNKNNDQHQLLSNNDSSSIQWQDILQLSPVNLHDVCEYVPDSIALQQKQHNNRNQQQHLINNNNTDTVVNNSIDNNQNTNTSSSSSSSSSSLVSPMITYHQAASEDQSSSSSSYNDTFIEWKNHLLEFKLRHILEKCDTCHGVIIMNDSIEKNSFYSGITTSILRELYDECKSASKWNITINQHKQKQKHEQSSSSISSHERQSIIQMIVERGLSLHHSIEYSNAILPICIPPELSLSSNHNHQLLLQTTAIALETCTLPYRLNNNNQTTHSSDPSTMKPMIGLHGLHYYGNCSNSIPFGSTSYLNFREFMKSLQSSSSNQLRKIWELDIYDQQQKQDHKSSSSLWEHLLHGTSIERDDRMRQQQSGNKVPSQLISPPGSWLLDTNHQNPNGLLTCYSPSSSSFDKNSNNMEKILLDRTIHHHFALSTSLRTNPILNDNHSMKSSSSQLTIPQQYVTAMMQGMGIQYQPEQYVATFVPQSINQVLASSSSSSTSLFNGQQYQNDNVLTVLGNTTRRYLHLHEIVTELQNVFQSGTISNGYYNRQIALGLLPEKDDCQDTIETCYNIRDAYIPSSSQFFDIIDKNNGNNNNNNKVNINFHDDL